MEGREVQGHIGPQPVHHPARQPLDLLGGIVLARDQQRGDLEPDLGLVPQIFQRLQHRLEARPGELEIEVLGEGLEVHVGGVDVAEQRLARPGIDVAGGDGDGLDPHRMAGLRHVDGVLVEDHRVVVGEGHRAAAELERRGGDGLRAGLVGQGSDLAALGDRVVLAELAGQVAAGGAERQHRRSGQEVVQRLLLDRVDAEPRRAPPGGQPDLAALGRPDETEPALALVQLAFARTDIAADAAVRQRGPVPGGDRVGRQDVGQAHGISVTPPRSPAGCG